MCIAEDRQVYDILLSTMYDGTKTEKYTYYLLLGTAGEASKIIIINAHRCGKETVCLSKRSQPAQPAHPPSNVPCRSLFG